MEEFARSDLAAECGAEKDGEGIRATRSDAGRCEILRVQVKSREAAERIGKPEGRYVTVDCGDIRDLDEVEWEEVRRTLAVEVRDMAERMCGKLSLKSGLKLIAINSLISQSFHADRAGGTCRLAASAANTFRA